jgi:hypothetical protein
VDQTKPVVEAVRAAWTAEGGRAAVVLTWRASDECLARHPISRYYAANEVRLWTVIARGLDNDGRYAWQPPALPGCCWVRVEALAAAGNVGVAQEAVPPRDALTPAAAGPHAAEVGP